MTLSAGANPNTLAERLSKLNWGIITILCALACIGVLMHFSVSSGAWTEMPLSHGLRFALMMSIALVAAMLLDAGFWLAIAYPRLLHENGHEISRQPDAPDPMLAQRQLHLTLLRSKRT